MKCALFVILALVPLIAAHPVMDKLDAEQIVDQLMDSEHGQHFHGSRGNYVIFALNLDNNNGGHGGHHNQGGQHHGHDDKDFYVYRPVEDNHHHHHEKPSLNFGGKDDSSCSSSSESHEHHKNTGFHDNVIQQEATEVL